MTQPFLVLGLPRSMTAWASVFLTCGPVFCRHEVFGRNVTPRDVVNDILRQPFQFSGIADPGALPYWRELSRLMPSAPVVFIHRPLRDSLLAFARVAGVDPARMVPGYRVLSGSQSGLLQEHGTKVIPMDALATDDGMRSLWQHVAPGVPLLEAHLRKMRTMHIEQLPELIRAAVGGTAPKL